MSEWLIQQGADTVLTRRDFKGKGPSYVFSDAEVDVHITDAKSIEEAIEQVRRLP